MLKRYPPNPTVAFSHGKPYFSSQLCIHLKEYFVERNRKKNRLTVSVIIPTLNEENTLPLLLTRLKQMDSTLEIIVVDALSSDETAEIAAQEATVIQSAPGRGLQMNAGAELAGGEILWFLHADTLPHPGSLAAMKKTLRTDSIAGGGFEYSLNHPAFRFRVVEFLSNRKNKLLGGLFGDMGIFVRHNIFFGMDGYRALPLM